jgi:hypothetical protein
MEHLWTRKVVDMESLDGVVRISVESPLGVVTSLEMELPVAKGDGDRSVTANGKVPQAATTVGRQP